VTDDLHLDCGKPATGVAKAWLGGLILSVAVCVFSVGCGSNLSTEYGRSDGRTGMRSVNGLGAFRQSLEAAGWKTTDIRQLGDRLSRLDAIIWTPTVAQSLDPQAMAWFADWLRRRPRTLIVVLPDPGSEGEYWDSLKHAGTPGQRIEYRRRAAERLTAEMTDRTWGTRTEPLHLDGVWFSARRRPGLIPSWELSPRPRDAGVVSLRDLASGLGRADRTRRATAKWLELIDDEFAAGHVDPARLSWVPVATAADGTPLAVRIETASTFGGDESPATGDLDVFDSATVFDPLDDEEWDSDEEAWGGDLGPSRLVVVAGGSLINNYAIARHPAPQGRRLVRQLAHELPEPLGKSSGSIGFLLTGDSGVAIRPPGGTNPTSSGMEWLTVWPLSLVTIHLAWIGLVACLILLPIFGRPRRLTDRSQGDFADHIHAVGLLIKRSGGQEVARQRISEYFRRVRGETSGPWVLPEPPPVIGPTRHSDTGPGAIGLPVAGPPVAGAPAGGMATGEAVGAPQAARAEPRTFGMRPPTPPVG